MDRSGRYRTQYASIITTDVYSCSKDGLRDAADCPSYGELPYVNYQGLQEHLSYLDRGIEHHSGRDVISLRTSASAVVR